jgi:pyrimidine-nucleoside phosphorylase
MMEMIPQWIIEKKRDGKVLGEREIRAFINGFAEGKLPDYQMAAMAMAIYFQGMTTEETASLTDAMMKSGDVLSWEGCHLPTADKHSTGGIGDKISLMLAPLVATQGVAVPMISGRGLGITGGTLDKLESIPGYNTQLDTDTFQKLVAKIGCSIIGQTARLAPADKKLYALRDVTGTVPSIPLITASIMSKKLAEGAETLVFDVKYGRAAFMKSREEAERLRDSLVSTGLRMGRKCAALLTPMDAPHGRTAGNAVEVLEAVETLKNEGPKDTRALTLALALEMVALAKPDLSREEIKASLEKALADGSALDTFRRMVEAQGGDPSFIDNPGRLPQPKHIVEVRATSAGVVSDVNAEIIGRIVLELGGGRRAVTDKIDYAAGVDRIVQLGERVAKGDVIMRLLASDEDRAKSLVSAANNSVVLL